MWVARAKFYVSLFRQRYKNSLGDLGLFSGVKLEDQESGPQVTPITQQPASFCLALPSSALISISVLLDPGTSLQWSVSERAEVKPDK